MIHFLNKVNDPLIQIGTFFSKPGNTLNTRYVLDTPPFDRTDYKFYLNMKNGGPGKVKINYIRIERY